MNKRIVCLMVILVMLLSSSMLVSAGVECPYENHNIVVTGYYTDEIHVRHNDHDDTYLVYKAVKSCTGCPYSYDDIYSYLGKYCPAE